MANSTAESTATPNGILGRTARPPGQLWQVPMFLVGLVALAMVAAAAPWTSPPDDKSPARDLAVIRHALEKPGVPADHIVTLAENAAALASHQSQWAGETNFLLGAILLRKAERTAADPKGPSKERAKEEREKAGMHLGLAELRGVPPEDKARLTYLLGKLAYLNNNIPRAIDLLTQSLPAGAENPAEGYGILVKLELLRAVPDLEAALAANLRQLEYEDDEKILTQARMLRGELLLKIGKRDAAIKVLDAIPPKAPAEIRLKARYLQAQAAYEEKMWGSAIRWWNELLGQPTNTPVSKARILYNLGVCYLNFEPPTHEKEAIVAWNEAKNLGGEEAQAAVLALGELRLFSGGNPAAALDHFKEALDKVCTPSEYKNSLVELRKACQLLEEACRIFDERQDNEHFLQAAELYKKVAAPGVADELIGNAAEARGRELLKFADDQVKDRSELLEKARTSFQKAALAYEKAYEVRSSPADSVEALWRCIECYRLAEQPERAVEVLKKYVTLPMTNDRKAEAWFTLAEIQRKLRYADAAESYKQCVAFNNDDFTARALVHLAQMALADQRFADAEAMLRQVINPPSGIITDRESHQLAFLMLADLYYQQRQFEKSAFECKEMMKQYPGHPSVLRVREQLGECYRILAKQVEDEAKLLNLTAAKKAYLEQTRRGYLESALQIYLDLAGDLEAKANNAAVSRQTLSSSEDALRRKAYFVTADCYFDLGNFEESFQRYTRLSSDFRDAPEGLWACQRIYKCWMRALNPRHEMLDAVHESALATVEHCVNHLDEYELWGSFRTPADKASWQRWLDEAYDALKKAGGRRG